MTIFFFIFAFTLSSVKKTALCQFINISWADIFLYKENIT